MLGIIAFFPFRQRIDSVVPLLILGAQMLFNLVARPAWLDTNNFFDVRLVAELDVEANDFFVT